MTVCGKVVVRVQGDAGEIFTGVGPIGWRRRFSWRGVSAIRVTEQRGNRGGTTEQLTLQGEKPLNFAGGVNAGRRAFMQAALRQMQRLSRG